MNLPLCDFLVSGQCYLGWFSAKHEELKILDQGRGPYYGVSWSKDAVFVLARNDGNGDLILVFHPDFSLAKIIEVGRDIDGHQIHFADGTLFVTSTRENALLEVNPGTEEQRVWNWTEHSTDVNHINGIGECESGYLWISHDNRNGTPSEIVQLSLGKREVEKRVLIEGPQHGTHNIEAGIVLSSGADSVIWDIDTSGVPQKVFTMPDAFFRGLGRFADAAGAEHLLVGASPVLEREYRSLPNECLVHVLDRMSWKTLGAIQVPGIGQIHDVRSLAGGFAHNKTSFPAALAQQQLFPRLPARIRGGLEGIPHESDAAERQTPSIDHKTVPADDKPKILVNFTHGIGDFTMFAHQIPLYIRAGYEVHVGCRPDKRILLAKTGAKLVEPQADWPRIDWNHPPQTIPMHDKSLVYWNKAGWNFSISPMPDIGTPVALWDDFCAESVDVRSVISQAATDKVEHFIAMLPRPIVLLHSKGNSFQDTKSMPDAMVEALYQELLDRMDGTIVLLDWDKRVPRLAHYRVRHLTDDWDRIDVEVLLALLDRSDLLIGIDSGPLHATRYTDTPALGVFWHNGHHPARYCLPRDKQVCIVPEKVLPDLTRRSRLDYHILTSPGDEITADFIAQQAARMLQPTRYLKTNKLGADIQLQQMVLDWSRGSGNEVSKRMDRDNGWDVILRACTQRSEQPMILETGCIRSRDDWRGAGNSTVILGEYCHHQGGKLVSIDNSPEHCLLAREVTSGLSSVEVRCGDSVALIGQFHRAYAWALWKIEAMILLLKLGEKAASLRFDLIEPFDSWSFKSLADISRNSVKLCAQARSLTWL